MLRTTRFTKSDSFSEYSKYLTQMCAVNEILFKTFSTTETAFSVKHDSFRASISYCIIYNGKFLSNNNSPYTNFLKKTHVVLVSE
jgi:hypothetical protein